MNTRAQIIQHADKLIRNVGYNAFSFVDIARSVGIKKPSVHHHFPHKADLCMAVIQYHIDHLKATRESTLQQSPLQQLERFLAIYQEIKAQQQICIVGALSTDYNTLEPAVQEKLQEFSAQMIDWVSSFLKAGKTEGTFHFKQAARTKAIMLISGMLAIVQLTRLTHEEDFRLMIKAVKQELQNK
ncbi:MAG: TetR family transcriptional regulator [Bacteroidetes bacterium 43-16]|nr:MAG: TetR family transcriptional regulator [Bacteroidetes bacterium 43-16]